MKLAIAVCLVGCGAQEETTVAIERAPGAVVDVLAVRVADGPWQALHVDATRFVADGKFTLAAACVVERSGLPSTYTYGQRGGTTEEQRSVPLPCSRTPEPGPYHEVSIQMLEPGEVAWSGATTHGAFGPWISTTELPGGTHTLVASDATRIAVRREVVIGATTTLSPISLAAEGAPREEHAFTLRDGSAFTWSALVEIDGTIAWRTTGTTTAITTAPRSELADGDRRSIVLAIDEAVTPRSIVIDDLAATTPRELAMLPRLDGITRDGEAMRWSILPELATLAIDAVENTPGFTVGSSITVTPAWLAGADGLAPDYTGIPGWSRDWPALHTSGALYRLTVSDTVADGVTRYSSFRQP